MSGKSVYQVVIGSAIDGAPVREFLVLAATISQAEQKALARWLAAADPKYAVVKVERIVGEIIE